MRESILQTAESAERREELFLRCQRGSHFCFSRPTAEYGNLRTRQEGLAEKELGENNAQPATPGSMNILPRDWGGGDVPYPPDTHTRLWAAATRLTLMMLLRRGVARAASRRPVSLSAGTPAAPGNATPLRRSLIRPPEAAGAASPEAASAPARGSSSPPATSRGAGASLPAAPSAIAEHVLGSRRDSTTASGVQPRARVRSGAGRKETPARLCFSARRRLQWQPQLCREETSLGQRRPRAVVQEVSGPARAGGGGGEKM